MREVNRSVFAEIFPAGTQNDHPDNRKVGGSRAIRVSELFPAGISAKKDAEPRANANGRNGDNQAIRGQAVSDYHYDSLEDSHFKLVRPI